MATNDSAGTPGNPDLPALSDPAGTEHDPVDAGDDVDGGDDRDPKISAALGWAVTDQPGLLRRLRRVQSIIDTGGMQLSRDHLEWLRYVLNWADVEKTLPRQRKDGKWLHRAGRQSMSGYNLYYLDLVMPTQVLLQQLLNYRLRLGRVLPKTPTLDKPVSLATPMTGPDGRPLLALMHTYASPEGLQDALVEAHTKLIAFRKGRDGWEPLRDMIYRDGVEDGGLWMQTVFAPAREDGLPNERAAVASLAPADAASRKAVCDDRIDPGSRMAAVPLLLPRRVDVFGDNVTDPSEVMPVAAAVGTALGKLRKELADSGARYLDQVDDDLREILQTIVMPVRLVYAIEDTRGRGPLDAAGVFREIQEHFHGRDHLSHPEGEAERLVADKVREALYDAADDGRFTITDQENNTNADGEQVPVAWSRQLIDVLAGHAPYTALAPLALPADRFGAAVAATMLVYGTGPERGIIGQVLGSKRNGGRYDNVLATRRSALLREMIFPDILVNTRAFEPVSANALWADPPTGWDGDTDGLIDLIVAGTYSDAQRALFDIIAITAAAAAGMPVVDLGSSGASRGFFRTKAFNATVGLEAIVEKNLGRRERVTDPAGLAYVRALLNGRLLLADPVPQDSVDAPTTAQWQQWAAAGVGQVDRYGTPELRPVVATVVDEHGQVVYDQQGRVERTQIMVPELVDPKAFDRFSTKNMQVRGENNYKQGLSPDGPAGRPETPQEQTTKILDGLAGTLSGIDTGITGLEAVTAGGHILSGEDRSRIEGFHRKLREQTRQDKTGSAVTRIDDLLEADDRRREHRDSTAQAEDEANAGPGAGDDQW